SWSLVLDKEVMDSLTVKIILPEGAKNIQVHLIERRKINGKREKSDILERKATVPQVFFPLPKCEELMDSFKVSVKVKQLRNIDTISVCEQPFSRLAIEYCDLESSTN
ncbi:hypothetical protein MJT46_015655, partial [Ovis ammon polii x Ovis aries]